MHLVRFVLVKGSSYKSTLMFNFKS